MLTSLFQPEVRQVVERRLGTLRPESNARWGRMSAHQTVCHLADSFRFVYGERPTDMRGSLFTKTVIRFVALTTPVPWPKGVPTAPEMDQEVGGTAPSEYRVDVDDLKALIARFVDSAGREMESHPIFGDLTPGEWGRWGYRHVDHHLTQFGM